MIDAVVVLQARMGSSRLPGKVLMEIGGRSLLDFMLQRLRPLGLPTVVATSNLERDDPIVHAVELAALGGVTIARGSETDVLDRFVAALESSTATHIVRMTADCPLADPALVIKALEVAARTGAHYVSNSLVRTYPDGLDVEVIDRNALLEAHADATDSAEREHVTPYLYRRPARFDLAAFVDDLSLGHERWTVDTADDLGRMREIVDSLSNPLGASWTQVLDAAGRRVPEPSLRPDLHGDEGPPTTPARRTWTVVENGQTEGWIGITMVEPGRAIVRGDLPVQQRDHALDQLRLALTADLQVADLIVPDDWSNGHEG